MTVQSTSTLRCSRRNTSLRLRCTHGFLRHHFLTDRSLKEKNTEEKNQSSRGWEESQACPRFLVGGLFSVTYLQCPICCPPSTLQGGLVSLRLIRGS